MTHRCIMKIIRTKRNMQSVPLFHERTLIRYKKFVCKISHFLTARTFQFWIVFSPWILPKFTLQSALVLIWHVGGLFDYDVTRSDGMPNNVGTPLCPSNTGGKWMFTTCGTTLTTNPSQLLIYVTNVKELFWGEWYQPIGNDITIPMLFKFSDVYISLSVPKIWLPCDETHPPTIYQKVSAGGGSI